MGSGQLEYRALTSFALTPGAAAANFEIFPASLNTWEIIEIVIQPAVNTAEVTNPITVQILTGANASSSGTPRSPVWNAMGGQTISDVGFLLDAGSNIALKMSYPVGASARVVSAMVRYRNQPCHEADTAIRRSLT